MEIRRFDEIDHDIEQIPDSQVVGTLELDFSELFSVCLSVLHLVFSKHHLHCNVHLLKHQHSPTVFVSCRPNGQWKLHVTRHSSACANINI